MSRRRTSSRRSFASASKPSSAAIVASKCGVMAQRRVTLGVKISMFIPKLVVEATQGEERSYAAKVAFGF